MQPTNVLTLNLSPLIQLLELTSDLPLKIFFSSRDDDLIHSAFYSSRKLATAFKLHEVEKHMVEDDIRKYIERSLSEIKSPGLDYTLDAWPSPSELSKLIRHSRKPFIYVATAIRYIKGGGGVHYKSRLSAMANRDSGSGGGLQTSTIDHLYGHTLEQACVAKEESEVTPPMKRLVSIIVFFRNPLPMSAIASMVRFT